MACCRILTAIHAALFTAFLMAWTIALLSPVPQKSAEHWLGGPFWVFVFGKGLHIGAYAFLTVLGGTLPLPNRKWTWVPAGLLAHGAVTEFFQQFVGRTARLEDVGLDAIGVAIGGLVVWIGRALWARQKGPPVDERAAG